MNKTNFTISEDKKSLIMERVFQASQHNLWRAYTEKELFEQWFAPQGWTVTTKKFDFTESGENIYVMKCEDKAQGEWYGQVSAGKNMSAKRNCVSYSKPLLKNTYHKIEISEKLRAKVDKHYYVTKTLLGHYKIDQKLDNPFIEYSRYVLTSGTESERIIFAGGINTKLKIFNGELGFYQSQVSSSQKLSV